jgi:hypothetical protein
MRSRLPYTAAARVKPVWTTRAPDLEDGDLIFLDEEVHAYPSHRPILAQGEGQAEACLRNAHCAVTAQCCGGREGA